MGAFDGPLKVGVRVALMPLLHWSTPVIWTLKAAPAICGPGLATVSVVNGPAATVKEALVPVRDPDFAVRVVVCAS